MDFDKLKLYLIIDPAFCVRDPVETARAALDAGVRTIQLRDKRMNDETRTLGIELAALALEYAAVFIMNDDPGMAREVGALGVHLGPNDQEVATVRASFPDLVVGRSCGSVDQVLKAVEDGADYVAIGAIFEARGVKPDASAPRGLEVVRTIAESGLPTDVPVVAIGGITTENAPSVLAAGAHSVAVIRGICAEEDPALAVKKFLDAIG